MMYLMRKRVTVHTCDSRYQTPHVSSQSPACQHERREDIESMYGDEEMSWRELVASNTASFEFAFLFFLPSLASEPVSEFFWV